MNGNIYLKMILKYVLERGMDMKQIFVSSTLLWNAGLEEIFTRATGRPARTFPVRFPLLRLDRIYVKNAHASSPTALALLNWRHLSDHAPLSAEIHL